MRKTHKYWGGTTPTHCDVCGHPITDQFVDGRTIMGQWGMLCTTCHLALGVGLGLGRGQMYQKEELPDPLGLTKYVWRRVAG